MKLGREGEGAGVVRVGKDGLVILGMKGAIGVLNVTRNTKKGG